MRFTSTGAILKNDSGEPISGDPAVDLDPQVSPENRCYVATYMETVRHMAREREGFAVDAAWWEAWCESCVKRGHRKLFDDTRREIMDASFESLRISGAFAVAGLHIPSELSGDSADVVREYLAGLARKHNQLYKDYDGVRRSFWAMIDDGRVRYWERQYHDAMRHANEMQAESGEPAFSEPVS